MALGVVPPRRSFALHWCPADALPLPVLQDDGAFQINRIPRMSPRAFAFFKSQLQTYKPVIIQQAPGIDPEAKPDVDAP